MLPYTGAFAQLGVAIGNGFRMAMDEQAKAIGKQFGMKVQAFDRKAVEKIGRVAVPYV